MMSSQNNVEKANDGVGATIIVFAIWLLAPVAIALSDGEGTTSYRRAHAALLYGNILVLILFIIRRHDFSSMLRGTARVVRSPFSATVASYDDFCMIATLVGVVFTTVFVVDFGGASLLAARFGIVVLLISLKFAFDRWRARKRR